MVDGVRYSLSKRTWKGTGKQKAAPFSQIKFDSAWQQQPRKYNQFQAASDVQKNVTATGRYSPLLSTSTGPEPKKNHLNTMSLVKFVDFPVSATQMGHQQNDGLWDYPEICVVGF